jgi:integrase
VGRSSIKVTAKQVESLIKNNVIGRHSVGEGVYLNIKPEGSISWIFRYQLDGRRRNMGLGAYHRSSFTLADARRKADQLRNSLSNNVDPIAHRQKVRVKAEVERQKQSNTFQTCAEAFIDSKKAGWKNAKHHQQWVNTLTTYAFPVIGKTPVSEIETAQVLKILKPIWTTKTETATRVRTRIELVLDYAEALKLRSGSNPARWRGHLATILPNAAKIRKIEHHPALPYDELQPFMGILSVTNGIGARALEIAILTASRTFEVLGATWSEIDLEKRVWTVPEERMKAGIEHRIPLSESAMKVLKRMGRTDITVHGFRSTFRDWVAEKTNTPERIAESALAHRLKDASEAAYQRGDLIEKRQALMTNWANYCYPTKDKVVKLHG